MVRRANPAVRPTAARRRLCLVPKRLARRFGDDQSGLAALEFALILPIMVALYLGGVEIGDALTIKRKVTSVTSSLSDLVTQAKVIDDKDMNNIFDAAASIITPYDENKLRIKVSGVAIDFEGQGDGRLERRPQRHAARQEFDRHPARRRRPEGLLHRHDRGALQLPADLRLRADRDLRSDRPVLSAAEAERRGRSGALTPDFRAGQREAESCFTRSMTPA